MNIIYPRRRFVALPLCTDSRLRSLTVQTDNVLKTSFPFGKAPFPFPLRGRRCAQPQDSIKIVWPALPRKAGLVDAKI